MNDTDISDRPKWLLELENRKRKPRLAHEAGAGAPCVVCKATCPGLDLHFWRKICKNCKCSKDDHDVDDEDFPQFELLFGPSKKFKMKPTLLHINGGKGRAEEAFEWVPPGTTKELAADYMKALSVEKIPIKGSAGAILRRQLLQKQLPLHDIDYKTCDKLSDQEKKEFENYLENIKKYVGQGTVTKILSARPYNPSLLTPVNAADMQQHCSANKPNVPPSFIQLRTPSSFVPKNSYKKDVYPNAQEYSVPLEMSSSIPIFEKYDKVSNSSEIAKSEPIKNSFLNKGSNDSKTIGNTQTDVAPNPSECYRDAYKDTLKNPSTGLSQTIDSNPDDAAAAMLADTSPRTIQSSDIIGSTLDEKGLRFIREKLTNKYSMQENQTQQPRDTPNFARNLNSNGSYKNDSLESQGMNLSGVLIPPQQKCSTSEPIAAEMKVQRPNSDVTQSHPLDSRHTLHTEILRGNTGNPQPAPTLSAQSQLQPVSNNPQAIVNSVTTPATVIYSEKLQNQIFPHEIVATKQLGQFSPNTENLETAVRELTIDNKSQNCHKCEEEIRVGDVAIITEKAKNAAWHPGCFVCSMCNELLVDLVYFYYKNKLYCGRDLATLLGIPRCFACDELIFVREYTVAEGHNYHVNHFCCWDCDIPLAGKQYITENDRPLCLLCYQKSYAKTCNMCEKVIAADQQGVAVKDLNFHATGACFCCYICSKNLLNGKFAVKEKRIFCSKDCISKFSS
ncbi:testin-like [Ceratina calcarata]|uniref:Testin-like n=1 Tax=Ceratina calcarata TaxID=156304 RepID=A0AAJ7N5Z3_9HYME|nr:testin-like [Ceratina calcarata]